jgi:hypothetical protein
VGAARVLRDTKSTRKTHIIPTTKFHRLDTFDPFGNQRWQWEIHGNPLIPYAPCMEYLYTYIWVIYGATVGKYSIHGAYGYTNGTLNFFQWEPHLPVGGILQPCLITLGVTVMVRLWWDLRKSLKPRAGDFSTAPHQARLYRAQRVAVAAANINKSTRGVQPCIHKIYPLVI